MPKHVCLLPLLMTVILAHPAGAQHHGHGAHAGPPSPYAGLQSRPIRALSAEEVADLESGRGMGLALAAELNGYPGPVHVLEHAGALTLTADQRSRMEKLLASMKAEAVVFGANILAAEEALDRQFRDRAVTPPTLGAATSHIGRLRGELRCVHLKYHLAMVEVLTGEQVRRYNELRGYVPAGQPTPAAPRP